MTRLIMFLICLKLGVKECQLFWFTNQADKSARYYINNDGVWKITFRANGTYIRPSNVSINWLLNPCCEIEKVEVGR